MAHHPGWRDEYEPWLEEFSTQLRLHGRQEAVEKIRRLLVAARGDPALMRMAARSDVRWSLVEVLEGECLLRLIGGGRRTWSGDQTCSPDDMFRVLRAIIENWEERHDDRETTVNELYRHVRSYADAEGHADDPLDHVDDECLSRFINMYIHASDRKYL